MYGPHMLVHVMAEGNRACIYHTTNDSAKRQCHRLRGWCAPRQMQRESEQMTVMAESDRRCDQIQLCWQHSLVVELVTQPEADQLPTVQQRCCLGGDLRPPSLPIGAKSQHTQWRGGRDRERRYKERAKPHHTHTRSSFLSLARSRSAFSPSFLCRLYIVLYTCVCVLYVHRTSMYTHIYI